MSTLSDSSRQNTKKENGSFSVLSLPAWLRQEPTMSLEDAREELEALSYDDQVRIEREKFGMIEYPVEETPELIALAMEELEEALSTMPAEKEAYETMLFIDPEYVQSEEFQLPFLRADLFNTSAAARRIVDYWEHKVRLFGTGKGLKRHISLLDLKEEDYRALQLSGTQLLPRVDEAGRAIILQQSKYFSRTADSMVRTALTVTKQKCFFL